MNRLLLVLLLPCLSFSAHFERMNAKYRIFKNGKEATANLFVNKNVAKLISRSKIPNGKHGLKKIRSDLVNERGYFEQVLEFTDEMMDLEYDNDVDYFSFEYSDGKSKFFVVQDVIVKLKPDVQEYEMLRLAQKLDFEITHGKYSERKWAIEDFCNLRFNGKSSNSILKKLRVLYKMDIFLSVEFPRTYKAEMDDVTLTCNGNNELVEDPLLIDNATDLAHTPNRSYANVFNAWCYNKGTNVRVGILDHGFNVEHPELVGQIADSFNVATGNHSGLEGSTVRNTNHGTTCTGILVGIANNNDLAAGIAPDAQAYVCRMTSSTSATEWIDALQFFIDSDVHVVSSSIRLNITPTSDRSSAADQQFFNLISNNDIVWCQSPSNCPDGCAASSLPHSYPVELQSVNATDFENAFFNVSGLHTTVANYSFEALQKRLGVAGPEINISYPAIQNLVYHFQDYTAHDHASGTSWATPSVAGIVALVRSQIIAEAGHAGNVEDVIRIIEESAMREPTYEARDVNGNAIDFTDNYNESYGFGIPDANAAVEQAIDEYRRNDLTAILQLLLLD